MSQIERDLGQPQVQASRTAPSPVRRAGTKATDRGALPRGRTNDINETPSIDATSGSRLQHTRPLTASLAQRSATIRAGIRTKLRRPLTASLAQPSTRTHAGLRSERLRENLLSYAFLLPSLILFGVFLFYPMLKSVYLSFQLTDPRGRVAAFAGWDNYREIFTTARFLTSLKVTALFTLCTVPPVLVWGLLLAALTHARARGMKLMQFIFSLPVALSVGTSSVMWMMLYHPTTGMLNYFRTVLGLDPVHWLTDPRWALPSVALMTVWMNIGFTYIVLLGGLKGIPEELFDSARIDGAGPVRTFCQIAMPLLSPTLFFLGIVSVIGAFQSFGQIQILTKGGPIHKTDVVVYNIYQEAFINYRFGTGSAQALVLFAIILILTFIQYRFLERKVHYQ